MITPGFNLETAAYGIIVGTHLWMLFVPLTMAQVVPHAISNLLAAGYLLWK